MRTRQVLHNLVANAVLQVATAVAGLILPALLIRTYGSAVNGLVGSIRQFLGFAALVEAGIGTAAIASLYRPLTSRDFRKLSQILTAVRLFYLRAGRLFLVAILVMAGLMPWLLAAQVPPLLVAALVGVLGCVGLFDFLMIAKYRVLLFASGRNYVMSYAQTANVLVTTAVSVALIVEGASILVVLGASSAISILSLLFLWRTVRRIYPEVRYTDVSPDFGALGARRAAFVQQLTGLVIFSSPVVLLTLFASLPEVSVYLVYAMIFVAVGSLVGIVSTALLATFGQLGAADDLPTLRKTFVVFEKAYFIFMGWAYACAGVLIMPFIHLYTAGMVDAAYSRPILAALFVAVGVANNIRVPFNLLVTAHGLFRETLWRAVLEMTINLVASLILVQKMGVVGVLVGALCSYAYRVGDFIIFASRRILKEAPSVHMAPIVLNVFAGCILAWIGFLVVPSSMASYLVWGLWALGTAAVIAGALVLLNLGVFPSLRGVARRLVLRSDAG